MKTLDKFLVINERVEGSKLDQNGLLGVDLKGYHEIALTHWSHSLCDFPYQKVEYHLTMDLEVASHWFLTSSIDRQGKSCPSLFSSSP